MGVRRREKVYIEEDRDYEPDTRSMVFTGTFSSMDWEPDCRGLSADEAIAWARARADVVLVLVGDGQAYSAGAVNPGYAPQWPPRNVDLLGRRQHGELRSANDPADRLRDLDLRGAAAVGPDTPSGRKARRLACDG